MMTSDRYERNIGTISLAETEKLRNSWVLVAGCGGLGGHVIEGLARLGVGQITAVDGDVFSASNLNRQLLSTERTLGRYKALEAQERIKMVNSEVQIHPLCHYIDENNVDGIITDRYDAVVDALDNIKARRLLEQGCREQKLPLVHGAIAGWHGQAAVIMPGDDLFDKIYPAGSNKGAEQETGNPSFTPAMVAAVQVAETVKVLLGKPQILRNRLLTIDLLNQEYEVIRF